MKRLPETLSVEEGQNLLRELSPCLTVNRPCLVIDCSILRRMDAATIHLLLCCLEEAMKRNGDVRLAGVSPEARAILKSTGADRLFRIFDLSGDAERSFDRARHDDLSGASSVYASDELQQ
jgi:anti-anti-sigma factor